MPFAVLLILTLLHSACAESGDGADAAPPGAAPPGAAEGPVHTDSAGVPVVVNPAEPPGGAVWRLAATPRLEIGRADGAPEELLFQAFGGLVLSGGGIVLANTGTFELRFYDAEGRRLRSVGGEGDGPGEFRRLQLAGSITGDSILAFDSRLRRVTVFAPDGAVARVVPVSAEVDGALRLIGALADGRIVLGTVLPVPRETGVAREPLRVGILSADGTSWTPLGDFPGREVSVAGSSAGSSSFSSPFGPNVRQVAAGDRIVVGTNDAFSLRVHDASGRLMRLIRQNRPLRPADPDEIARVLEPARARSADRPGGERMLAAIDQLPLHETLPAFAQLLLDRTGHLWIQEFPGSGARPTDWQVFDPEGVLVARVGLPDGLEILDVGPDYLLGRVSDDLGVERVRLYDLERGTP